ncbi:hypothetical protein BDV06DRAFT_218341 [Aspergillus oleicola]
MPSNIFDNIHSPVSYDADIDRGWRPISEKSDEPIKVIFQLLQRVYWDAVKDEMANAILAFDDYKTFVPGGLPDLKEGELESGYLRELLDLWDPIGLPEDIKDNVCRSVFDKVKERQKVSQDEIVARALLQACGFCDYDYVQEYRRPTIPSLGPAPQGISNPLEQRFRGIYEAIQCSECRFCIRSFHFYECCKGCSDYPVNRNHIKTVQDPKSPLDFQHRYLDSIYPVPYRLCCNCIETSSHQRDHLKIAYRFKKSGETEVKTFSQELDVLEDHIKGQNLLSFGNAFLDHISSSGLRRSRMSARRLFPAGNAHCALMFGPLLIENGMTIHPGGALISTRTLPSLGRHSPREVKEYLRPDYYRIIQGCDVFCADIYSVSPDRRVYEATKRAKERRFLCSRKQLSGGLFTNYNHSRPGWKIAEDTIVELFLNVAAVWTAAKSPMGREEDNRGLLQNCAVELTETMKSFLSEEIDLHLFLLAQKLGKTQKLAYSRMSSNCQDFCNGLLEYDSYTHPIFNSIYPFIPVCLSPEIQQEPDDRSLSYLQSFVRPLQYPIPGSSKRAMLGSAVTMYSSYAQNDADMIDHVYGVRFGVDHDDGFSLGFSIHGEKGRGDPYLLKDEEMSCSDRFASTYSSERVGPVLSCSITDHLLDCPVDNLSILSTHLHRQKKYYIDPESQEFLVNLPPAAWVTNRLQVLRRLKLLHDFLAEIAAQFQECCRLVIAGLGVGIVDVKTLRKSWKPQGAVFSRAWHMDKRDGNMLYFAPDIDFGSGEMNNWKAVGFLTFGTTFMQTHRQLIGSDELVMTRLKAVKSRLVSQLAGKEVTWTPWEACTCDSCKLHGLRLKCHRLDFIASANQACLESGEEPAVKPGNPDYIAPREIERLIRHRGSWDSVVKSREYTFKSEEEYYDKVGPGWISTYLLCLRIIFGAENANEQFLRWRLDEYAKLANDERSKA